MRVIHDLKQALSAPCVLTIGNFDGLHLGHKQVIDRLVSLAKEKGLASWVLTFSNHPSDVLTPDTPKKRLLTNAHKLNLLEELSVDYVLCIPFTKSFAQQTPRVFLETWQKYIPLKHLILGYDTSFGKDRTGNKEHIQVLAKQMQFEVEHLPPFTLDGQILSSSYIRTLLEQGKLEDVERALNRPFSLYASVQKGLGQGKSIGYPTANIHVASLALPPKGVWIVSAQLTNGKKLPAIANLGYAPTIRNDNTPLLEVHFLEDTIELYDKPIEVFFHAFIREEKRFASISALQCQIKRDVAQARSFFATTSQSK